MSRSEAPGKQPVRIRAGSVVLIGDLVVPPHATGVVLFAHGSGSGRHSPRNQFVARHLQRAALATLLIDLLTDEEEAADRFSGHLRFDIGLLAERLLHATDWLSEQSATANFLIGYFGASTGGGAALVAAARRPDRIHAVVCRGGRPDLAGDSLTRVRAPTLLLVGERDPEVLRLNQAALQTLSASVKELVVIPGASHLFVEPGTLEEVARYAGEWFNRHLNPLTAPLALR